MKISPCCKYHWMEDLQLPFNKGQKKKKKIKIKTFNCMFLSCHIQWIYSLQLPNDKDLVAWSRCNVWSLSDFKKIQIHNHVVQKLVLNHLARLVVCSCGFESHYSHLKNVLHIPGFPTKGQREGDTVSDIFDFWSCWALFCIEVTDLIPTSFFKEIVIAPLKMDACRWNFC